jgi:hypothetical protein
MSKYSLKPLTMAGLGLSVASTVAPSIARSQEKPVKKIGGVALPDPDQINKTIQQNHPPELFNDQTHPEQGIEAAGTTTTSPTVGKVIKSAGGDTTAVGSANYTFIVPTPLLITMVVIVGGLALFPVVHLLLNSKKMLEFKRNSVWSKLTDRFQKPRILESDEFLHQRNLDQLIAIGSQAETIHGDKFGNDEFTTFVKIKSYINRSIGEYAGLDDIMAMLTAAIGAQNSFLTIEGGESRHCSSNQQELYKLVNQLLKEELDGNDFTQQVNQKLAEVLPLLKTEEGKIALQAYATEIGKVAQTPLGLKLLLLFKRYKFDDFSVLRGVNNTINQLGNEDLLNLDGLLLLVMVKYDVFEKLGPIIGVPEEYNRPETYAKMLQYFGLKAKHEVAYQKFQEFLLLMKKWETYHKTVTNVRQKYDPQQYRLPKSFSTIIPATELYEKYQDILPKFGSTPSKPSPVAKVDLPNPVVDVAAETEAEVLVGMK